MLAAVATGITAYLLSAWPLALAIVVAAGSALLVVRWNRGATARPLGEPADVDGPMPGMPAGEFDELIRRVVPTWLRTMEAARRSAESHAESLTERFAQVSAHLDVALAATAGVPTLELGTLDALVEQHAEQLDLLASDTRQALEQVAHAEQQLGGVTHNIRALADLARQMQQMARATQMLALNAGVEATRAGEAGRGFAVVAADIREIAAQARTAAVQMSRELAAAQERIEACTQRSVPVTADEDDLALRSRIHARAVVRALLESLGQAARGSRTLHEAGRQAQKQIDDILIGLQAHDRINQMLQSVCDDIGRMQAWLGGARDEAAASPALWLERLEASYTMEDMRSTHHGTAVVEQSAGVEFF